MKLKDRVLKLNYKKNWYFSISFSKESKEIKDFNIRNCLSLIVLYEDYYIELIPKHGPITIIDKYKEGDEFKKEDYVFDFNSGRGNWSQLYFDKNNFNDLLIQGNYDKCFESMEKFK